MTPSADTPASNKEPDPESLKLLPSTSRLGSIDAYRGLVMFLMMAEVLRLRDVAAKLPQSKFWSFLAHHQEHVPWVGCTLHDMIQPSFSFLVGVAMPFSLAARAAKGQSPRWMTVHAFWRAFVLVALGIFLRSIGKNQTNYTFEDTLTQIGLGYGVLFLIGRARPRVAWISLAVILVGYFLAFALYPLPNKGFDWSASGVTPDWPENLKGFAAHWNKNTNLAWRFDVWFMNLFPRETPFQYNGGGYSTLSFLPTLATMILGLIAGRWISRTDKPQFTRITWMVFAGLVCLSLGFLLGATGICPIVKRIWTPSWTLYSGGWCFLWLAAFYAILDVIGVNFWAYPLKVIGANSIAAYMIAHLIEGFLVEAYKTHLGPDIFEIFGKTYEPLTQGAAMLLGMWLILWWMYLRKIFIRV